MCMCVCACVRAHVVCACMCTCVYACLYPCVFVNRVWILSSKNNVIMERNSSVWDDTYQNINKMNKK